ncbi:MAG: peptidoglycan DD-metalloendopeptidase family protein [Acidimicrobiales bacterium]
MRRLLLTATSLLLVAVVAAPVGAQDDGTSSSTSSSSSTTPTSSSTSAPTPTVTLPPEESTTTTGPPEDPVGAVDAPPEEVPVNDATVPPAPGTPVDAAAATRVIRRELDVARAEAVESEAVVADLADLVDELSSRLAHLQRELARLDVVQQETVARLEAAQERFEDRVANAVVRGNAAELDTIITSQDANEVLVRRTFLATVAEADTEAVQEYRVAKEVVDAGLLEAIEDVAATRRELRDARTRLREELALNAERRFQLAVFSAGSEIVIRGFVFPVADPYSFVDSWGFPRMTGTEYEHGHQGTDIMAPFGTPLHATERGIVTRMGNDVLGGQKLWLKGESGTYYYYAHLQAFMEGMVEGTLVEAGDVVGFVGDTGNARGGAPHLHFEVHPGGGQAVNPYGLLRAVSDLTRR